MVLSEEEQANLAELITARGHIKGKLTRFQTYLEQKFPAQPNTHQLKKRLESLEQSLLSEFESCQNSIEALDPSPAQAVHREAFENSYFDLISLAQETIDEHANASTSTVNDNVARSPTNFTELSVSRVNLPQINLPSFEGSFGQYMHFHDTFNSLIHRNTSISDVQKFHYLLSCLKGDAIKVVQALEVTDLNYKIAWDLLKERYENKRAIINCHVKALFDLPNMPKENAQALRNFLDCYNKSVRALKGLGQPVESWDTILIYMLTAKLDFSSKREWESKVKPDILPKLTDFTEFLNSRCKLLEALYMRTNAEKGYTRPYNETKQMSHIATSPKESTIKCFHCKRAHFIYHCTDFLKLAQPDRYKRAKEANLCINCLRPNSKEHTCSGQCKICKGKGHNTLLHRDNSRSGETQEQKQNSSNSDSEPTKETGKPNVSISAHSTQQHGLLVLLGTAVIHILDHRRAWIECRCLMDGGSQSNFISSNLVKKLQLAESKICLPVSGINEVSTSVTSKVNTTIKSRHGNYTRSLSFLVLETITGSIPSQSYNASAINIPEDIALADPHFNESDKVDILLGASIFYDLLTAGKISFGKNAPILQSSKLGWLVTGPLQINQLHEPVHCLHSLSDSKVQSQLEKFWVLEDVACSERMRRFSNDEQYCEDHFTQNLSRDTSGKFTVALPLKPNYTQLGDTLEMARKRFLSLEAKFRKNKDFAERYKDFMREYENLGHMTKIKDTDIQDSGICYYLPHHGVIKEDSATTKLRVVFDGSAKGSTNISLNDVLFVGPTIQDDLFSILLRFRKHNFVLKGDICKMYRQVNIKQEQRNLQRILWRESPSENLSHYTLNTVTYGTASASFLAIRALHQTGLESRDKFPLASDTILRDFYVDDLITGSDSLEGLIKNKEEISSVVEAGGFTLRQWMSNAKELLDTSETQETYPISENSTIRTLGIHWNPNFDRFEISVRLHIDPKNLTKRIILSVISQVFDPLGLLGPIIIKAKQILQQLWKLKLDWDEQISTSYRNEVIQFFQDLTNLDRIFVPRHVLLPTYVTVQLHGFTDASERAYGVCIYLRTEDCYGKIYTQLLCSKSRVAPLKVISLPKLELCGALLLSRLVNNSVKALKINLQQTFFYTDSNIVLAWLSQEPTRWKTFIANRVSEIQGITDIQNWRHISSKDNPADVISRGCNAQALNDADIWWHGPEWLGLHANSWPNHLLQQDINPEDIPEMRNSPPQIHVARTDNFNLIQRYSSITKLQRITTWCMRFIHNTRRKVHKKDRYTGNLSVLELKNALQTLIKKVQMYEFSKEVEALQTSNRISKGSHILKLNPFLDQEGILRVGGRLANAEVEYDHKYPILLPAKHHFTGLIIRYEHERTLHGGVQTVLSSLRQKYWPIKAKCSIKKVIKTCIKCYRLKPDKITLLMGQLPTSRVSPTRPFLSSGIDYAGPFLIKDGTLRTNRLVKVYICLFICLSTKAIHLELVGDLSTLAFLNSFKRFIARRGIPKNIWSDNGTNFIGAAKHIRNLYKTFTEFVNDTSFQKYIADNQITWHFIPPKAPHFGGLWESAIKLTKYHLIRVIGLAHLTYESFHTVITQIESILNSRPITPISDDPNDLDPLTPGHFLIGSKLNALPEDNLERVNLNRLSKYQQVQQMTQSFWKRWQRDYLHNLQERNKWMWQDDKVIKPGLMVIVREDNLHPLNWKIGRIQEIHPGRDNIARVASVKTQDGVVKRAYSKLSILPIEM